jgi:V-type H+-transporting ATPase subunit F
MDSYEKILPTLLEIPSKDHPYNAEKDSLLKKIQQISSNE